VTEFVVKGKNISFTPRVKCAVPEIVQFQKISILPPQKGLEFPRGGGLFETKSFKEMYGA